MKHIFLSAALAISLTGCASLPMPETHSSPSDGEPQYVFTGTVQDANRIDIGRGAAAGRMFTYRLSVVVQYVARGNDYITPAQTISVEISPDQALPGQYQTCQFVAKERHPAYASGVLLLNSRILDCR
ncbi:MAG: hypothetical protein E6Q83_17015 [Thiothrix sp.]|nr:MAG: hypothetical protein E6Q83_17015 [Thiothrix sp.]